jgi:CSLREA domain-containing protein
MNKVRNLPRCSGQLLALFGLVASIIFYVAQSAQAATFAIPCNDTAGLIAAINTANSNGEADTIALAANCTYTLTAVDNTNDGANGLPSISSDITIVGNGTIIERSGAAPAFRLLHIAASGALTLDGVTLRGGQTDVVSFPSASGAAIFNNRGGLTIRNSHITLNTSIGSGAGIYNYSGTLLLTRSTISQNTAGGDGGGLQNDGGPAPAVATIENSTIAANVAGGGGGAIMTAFNGSTTTLNLYNSALVNNTGSSGTGMYILGAPPNNIVNVYNAILRNAGDECTGNSFAASDANLIDDATCGPVANPVTNLDATLASQGASTQMYALLSGSNAIDAGNSGETGGATVDQRRSPRVINGTVDIGPYEFDQNQVAPIFTVNSRDDVNDGSCGAAHCSLREAILAANATPNGATADEIHFTISGEGAQTIQPTSALPFLSEAVIIDGSTQPGANCASWPPTLQIALDGTNAGGGATSGLFTFTGNVTVRGLAIHSFANENIGLYGGNNTIQCNFFGTDVTGTQPLGNSTDNLFVNGTTNNLIGGATPGTGNLFGGGAGRGIVLAAAAENTVQGNYIGIDPNGTNQVGALTFGILVTGGNNQIGGTTAAERNIIAGTSIGINVAVANGNVIQGNYIGTNAAGTAGLGNGTGVWVNGNATNTRVENNLISGNGQIGVQIAGVADGTILRGNLIGTDATGTGPLGNGQQGVRIDHGTNTLIGTPGEGNTIAYNGLEGIRILTGVGNAIRENRIFANGDLGINLGADGVTFNHQGAITGPNNYQNFPVLTLATSDGANTRVQGTLESTPGATFDLDFFASATCDPSYFGEGENFIGTVSVATDGSGKANFDVSFPSAVAEADGVSAVATDSSGNSSEFSYCRPVATANVNWQAAQALSLTEVGGGLVGATVQQRIVDRFQEKWFKFPVAPGDKVHIELTSLPGSAVSLHRDPLPFYNSLTNPSSAAVLSAAVADVAFLPSQSLPSQSLPSQSLPSQSLPTGALLTGFLPSQSLPSQSLPSQSLPSQSLPSQSLPSQSLPSQSLPSGALPAGSLPSQSLPSQSLPSQSLPSQSLPSQSLPEAYSGAARRSLIAISLDPYATVHTIDRNTYDLLEDLYVRVVGPFDPANPFTLEVTVEGGVCSAVQAVPNNIPAPANPPAGARKSLILTDSSRLTGAPTEIAAALQKLQQLAGRPEVAGVVIDLADPAYQRVAWANDQADQNLACPMAKNLVADEIKRVIDGYRAANMAGGATTLQYIVLAGSADVIPFFQVPDVAGLANEKEYVPPVKPSTASEAGLNVGLVQSQDRYGAAAVISRGDHTLAVPDLAVGRLVESANDIVTVVDAYIATNGVVVPNSALVTGYDFVGDAARAINIEANAGTNATAELLIQDPGFSPSDPSAWSADDLRAKLFTGNHDLVVLSGHFSAGNLLAADYATTMTAAEVSNSPVDFTNVIVLTLGCHGGYTIPTVDQLPGASPDPDWPKAFLRKQAAGYIAATGYAYGDTELTEYGERLFVNLTQQLRTGAGPVALGQALVAAKQQYLAETAQLSGIDEKTIIEMTLYGLPMMMVNMPGARINPTPDSSIITAAPPVTTGPGATLGLRLAQPSLAPSLTANPVQLQNLADNTTVATTYLSGRNGVVANPFEPIFPKEIDNVNVAGAVLRGVAFRGGSYTDQAGVTPLTTAPATETSRPHQSFYSEVFYPTQMWLANYFDAITGGATQLVTVPAQFKSSAPGAINGTLRQFDSLQLNLYYLDANWTSGPPTVKAAAVAAAPTILGASATVTATNSGPAVTFSVNVQGEASAGIQSVWILYTGNSGSPFYGEWLPLDLAQPNAALDPTRWEGLLQLNGAPAEGLLFMVQAVNGTGATTLATNLGAYYPVLPATPPPPPQPTTLVLQPQPTAGAYLRNSTFTLLLTEQATGNPLGNQVVIVSLGGQAAQALTNANGQATITLQPGLTPGDYPVQATFRPTAAYLGSSASRSFTINKDSTALTLATQAPSLVALLRDSAGRALNEKSVFFVLSGNGQTFVRTVITDLYGNAPLGELLLPPGSYTVNAYFSGVIPLGNGESVTQNDDNYQPAQATTTLTIDQTDTTPPLVAVNFPTPPAAQNGWFNAQDAASGIGGTVTANETTTGGSNVTAIHCTGAATGALSGSGTTQASAALTVSGEGSNVVSCTATDSANNDGAAAGSNNTATVQIDTIAPETTITGQPINPTNSSSAAFDFTGNDGGSGVTGFMCQLDGGSVSPCSSPQSYSNLAAGNHTFTVYALDAANNPDLTLASYSWTIQATPGDFIGSCGGYDVYRTPQGQLTAPGWTGTILVGTAGPDTLNGGSGNSLILGLGGNDKLKGGSKDDVLCGHEGNDDLDGGSGKDLLYGGENDDKLKGGSGDDQLYGEYGADQMDGGAGNDMMVAGEGNDQLSGGSGNDQMSGEGGNDTLDGGSGNDTLTGGSGADHFTGGSGTDRATDLNTVEGDVNQGSIELIGPAAAAASTNEADPEEILSYPLFLPLVNQ